MSPVAVIILLLASLNSCTNPWIYLAFSGSLFNQMRVRRSFETFIHLTFSFQHFCPVIVPRKLIAVTKRLLHFLDARLPVLVE